MARGFRNDCNKNAVQLGLNAGVGVNAVVLNAGEVDIKTWTKLTTAQILKLG
jgi:hypothetical protein